LAASFSETPNIGVLPKEVADRIDDMSCALAMAVECVPLETKRARLYEYATKMQEVVYGRRHLTSVWEPEKFAGIGTPSHAFDSFVERDVNKAPHSVVRLQSLEISHSTCLRIGVQCALSLLHTAIGELTKALSSAQKETLRQSWLLTCLGKLRNVSVHQAPLAVRSRDFITAFVHRETGEVKLRTQTDDERFLDVEPSVLSGRRGISREKAEWFAEVCQSNPIWWIFWNAVGDLCRLCAKAGTEATDDQAPARRPYRIVFFRKSSRNLDPAFR